MHLFWIWKVKGHESQSMLAWFFALLWVLASYGSFSGLTPLIGWQEKHPVCNKTLASYHQTFSFGTGRERKLRLENSQAWLFNSKMHGLPGLIINGFPALMWTCGPCLCQVFEISCRKTNATEHHTHVTTVGFGNNNNKKYVLWNMVSAP